ncbi:hypothetical protein LXA43DRAFT_236407 [Ganoderma leucocontextum]|nr:hypothetical protein LXA43DRAFT_236407 [Ganoderma leucocontextum]
MRLATRTEPPTPPHTANGRLLSLRRRVSGLTACGRVLPLRHIYRPRRSKPFCPPPLFASFMDASAVASTSGGVDQPFGPYLIGSYVGLMMYGVTLHQAYRYFRLYPTDRLVLRAIVITLLVLDTFHTVTIAHTCYHYMVSNYSNPSSLALNVWSFRLFSVNMGGIIFVAHLFYIRRLYLWNTVKQCHIIIVIIVGSLMLVELGTCIAESLLAFRFVEIAGWSGFLWLSIWALSVILANDIVLSTTLVIILRSHYCAIDFKNTRSLIDLLTVYTINTCVLTTVLNATSLGLVVAFPTSMAAVGVLIPASRSYVNAVLAVLNSRKSLSEKMGEEFEFGTFGVCLCLLPVPCTLTQTLSV